jgi:16S rRNA (adenine1518-N6/adenine1519-N6)-dimethyltransferase
MKHIPKKSLGQHFLTDKNMIAKILRAIDAKANMSLLEIGPGEGALTHDLIKIGCRLTSLELDTELSKMWKMISLDNPQFVCVEGDATTLDWTPYLPVDKCVGNIPYNVSRPLMYKVFSYRRSISEAVFMVQKEFADKLTAPPGENAYGILSVLSASFADVEMLFTIPPSVFYPPPKVMSACVKLRFKDIDLDDARLIEVVQTAFNQRRKKIRNSLKEYYSVELEDAFDWEKRADELSADDYLELINLI